MSSEARAFEATHDVVIVGAGPAGSALAIELATEGVDVLLVDAARFPRDKVCGDYVSPRGLARLDALGCGGAVRAVRSTPIHSSRLYLNRDLLVEGTLPRVEGFPPHGLAIPRVQLDEIVFRRACAVGARAVEGCRVEGYHVTRDGVEVTATQDGRPKRIRARMVIGADGATSVVARTAGLRMNDARYKLASLRSYSAGLTLEHTVMFFDEHFFPGYGWVFPVRPGVCNVGVGMVTESLVRDRLRLQDFYAKLQRLVRRLADARGAKVTIERPRAWPIHGYGGARRNYFDRGLLVGEAGCFVDPINGEGIPLAMESARVAAKTIHAAFAAGRFDEQFLSRFERDWRGAFAPDLAISDLAVTLIRNRALLPLWMAMFKATSLTARTDVRYAAVTGGVLGGVIPARRAISSEMVLRTLAHGPAFWREVLGVGAGASIASWLSEAGHFGRWQAKLVRAAAGDPQWVRQWLLEVEQKQRAVAAHAVKESVFGG